MKSLLSTLLLVFLIGFANAQNPCEVPPTKDPIVRYSMDSTTAASVYMVQVVAVKQAMPFTPVGLIRQYDKRVKVYRYFVMKFFIHKSEAEGVKELWEESGYSPLVIRYEYGLAGA